MIMLETEEVDDDYFTPVTNTTLAGIFGNVSEDTVQDSSLKYMAPKPNENINKSDTSDDTKQSHCIFACTLVGYEWVNNVYAAKGKLGFAIIKFDRSKSIAHSVVLYDANKTSLSSALVTNHFEVTVKNDRYVSYYDNLKKYWSLCGTEEEVKKVVQLLRDINATVKYASDTQEGPHKIHSLKLEAVDHSDKASDTDTSVQNKKTKMSILNRMASMGQNVLPQQHINETSSSSESNEDSTPVAKHRPTKKSPKCHTTQRNISDAMIMPKAISTLEAHRKDIVLTNNTLYSYLDGQLVPIIKNDIVNTSSQESKDMNLFIYEQRMNNSELRINMNRMSDKVDQLVDKVKDLETSSQNSGDSIFQSEILQKLLVEYEKKIKTYEEQIKSIGTSSCLSLNSTPLQIQSNVTRDESDEQVNKIIILEDTVNEKDNEISRLQEEVKEQKIKFKHEIDKRKETESNQLIEITKLKQELSRSKGRYNCQNSLTHGDASVENKIKKIMNDTFRIISTNFEDNESYSGKTVKSIVVSVIKNVTIESFK